MCREALSISYSPEYLAGNFIINQITYTPGDSLRFIAFLKYY